MTDASISLMANLLTVFIALTAGIRLGYIIAARSSTRDTETLDRQFDRNRQLFERQYELQFAADQKRRAYEDMKESYEALGVWLHTLERTLGEINAGATTSRRQIREKARAIIGDKPWEVINTPVGLASAEFYWSTDIHTGLRKLAGPYSQFISRVKIAMDQVNDADSESDVTVNVDDNSWEYYHRLNAIISEVRGQARKDLLAG